MATAPADSSVVVPMAPAQWAQLEQAIQVVQAAGFGEVTLAFEHGHPRKLFTTVAALMRTPEQAAAAVQEFLHQSGVDGDIAVIVRNGQPTRVEVTTEDSVVVPPELRRRRA